MALVTKFDKPKANREQCRKLLDAAKPFWRKATYREASYSEDRVNSKPCAYANSPMSGNGEPSVEKLRRAVKAVKVAPCEGKGLTFKQNECPELPKAKKFPGPGNKPETQKVNKPVQNVFPARPRQPPVCYFHQQGACIYGPYGWNWLGRCQFRHP